jgi:hypothetical protein
MSNKIILDQTNRKILYYLSIGSKTKDLPKYFNPYLAGIEREKDIYDIFLIL